MTIVAFYSSTPGCGKTTAARILHEANERYTPLSFAGILDDMLRPLMDVFRVLPTCKESPITDIPGQPSYRYLKQTLGTEWGRGIISRDLWVSVMENKIDWEVKRGRTPVIDDLRYPNEYYMLKNRGALLVKLEREVKDESDNRSHGSNGALDDYPFDIVLRNPGDMISYRRILLTLPLPHLVMSYV
jgi:hypothetical protein